MIPFVSITSDLVAKAVGSILMLLLRGLFMAVWLWTTLAWQLFPPFTKLFSLDFFRPPYLFDYSQISFEYVLLYLMSLWVFSSFSKCFCTLFFNHPLLIVISILRLIVAGVCICLTSRSETAHLFHLIARLPPSYLFSFFGEHQYIPFSESKKRYL